MVWLSAQHECRPHAPGSGEATRHLQCHYRGMTGEIMLRTTRLLLRRWREDDWPAFAELNADPRVMEWFPSTLTHHESDALADRIAQRLNDQDWGLWAVEVPGVADFIGFIGLNPADGILGYPSVEVGWRLAASHWGYGYAPEGALAALDYGFHALALDEIISFTSTGNARSRRVMEKIGMVHQPDDDFDHPHIPPSSPLSRHVLYRLTRIE